MSFQFSLVTQDYHRVHPKRFLSLGYVWCNRAPILREDEYYLQTNRNELALEHHHVGVPSGASKMISEPMLR